MWENCEVGREKGKKSELKEETKGGRERREERRLRGNEGMEGKLNMEDK